MTCIVGLAREGRVWIGADSAGVGGYSLTQRADQKVFINGDFIFGFTSSFRMGQLLRYRFEPPRHHPDDDLLRFMSTEFVDEVRACLKKYGWAKIENAVEEGGTFLVGYKGQLFKVEDDFQVAQSIHPFDACGCGEDLALGALHAMAGLDLLAEARGGEAGWQAAVERALAAAEAFSAGVRAPFHVLSSGGRP
jgi:ATP-dependent protease HslVU (ClpYQ) peptidase subunit